MSEVPRDDDHRMHDSNIGQAMARAMANVKELTPRGTHLTLEETISNINQWYVGWAGYYKMTQYPSQLYGIEAHIRRRLRSRIVSQQKSSRNLFNKLISRKVSKSLAGATAYSNRKKWALSHSRAIEKAYSNKWFREEMGLKTRSNEKHAHWFELKKWIKLREEPCTDPYARFCGRSGALTRSLRPDISIIISF